jgi:hypothetical protein
MNFKSYNLFMAVVASLREFVDELKIITDEHQVFLNKVTGKTVTLTHEDISAVESGDDTAERQDWEQEVFEQAKEVLWSDDYLELPIKFDIHEYKIMEIFRLLPNAKLAILPEGYGEYIGEITAVQEGSKLPEMTVAMIEKFLDVPLQGENKK